MTTSPPAVVACGSLAAGLAHPSPAGSTAGSPAAGPVQAEALAACRPTAVAYLRVSTDQQDTLRQRQQIARYCTVEGIDLLEIIEEPEAVSGRARAVKRKPQEALAYYANLIRCPATDAERPGLRQLFARIEALRPDYAIFYALDRLSRDATELLLLRRILQAANCEIVALSGGGALDTSTASGWLQFVIQAMLAEHECLQISERTSASLIAKRHDPTVHVGRPPVGWRKIGDHYEHDPATWPKVEEAHELRHDHNCNYAQIAAALGIGTSSVKSYLDAYHWHPPRSAEALAQEEPPAVAPLGDPGGLARELHPPQAGQPEENPR